jgi:taurine transport system permease protein
MVAAKAGLGFMALSASEFLVTEVIVLGIIIGQIAYVFDLGMRLLEFRLVPWRGNA